MKKNSILLIMGEFENIKDSEISPEILFSVIDGSEWWNSNFIINLVTD